MGWRHGPELVAGPSTSGLIGFGETVMYKLPVKGPQHDPYGNVGDRLLQGIFLGYKKENSAYIIGTDGGTATSRATQRRPLENRWDEAAISQLATTPWQQRPRRGPEVHFEVEAPRDKPVPDDRAPTNPRRMRLNLSDFLEHGFSVGCRQCEYMQRHRIAKGRLAHTDTCRARLMAEMGKTVAGQLRLEQAE